jgi:hypothetical protein
MYGSMKEKDESMTMPILERMKSDNKKLPLSGSKVILYFFFSLLVVLPFWLLILVPIVLISLLFQFVFSFCVPKKKASVEMDESTVTKLDVNIHTHREYDLVLFGATGFTGAVLFIV